MSFLNIFTRLFSRNTQDSTLVSKANETIPVSTTKIESPSITPISFQGDNLNSGNLYWRLPATEKSSLNKFGKNVSGVFRKYKNLFPKLFQGTYEEIAQQFCDEFFLTGEAIFANLANLSLNDQSDKRITLSIRIPSHPIFNNKLDSNIAVSVIGYCPTSVEKPIFVPEGVFLTHGQFEPTNYEIQVEANFQQLERGSFPDRNKPNLLVAEFTKSLPKYALETKKRLEDWESFLTFKENLIKHKTQGVRYLRWKFEKDQLHFSVIVESKQVLEHVKRAFNRQNLHSFNESISTEPYRFILRQNDNDKINNTFANLGQIANNGVEIIQENNQEKKELIKICETYHTPLKKEATDNNFDFNKAIFALLSIDISEDLSYSISQLIDDEMPANASNDNLKKSYYTREEKIQHLFKNLPTTGFLSVSLVGDLALTDRHRRAVNNLIQNKNCYAPYLSSYLFDIKKANQPDKIPEITEWENQKLNDKQKLAIQKMLAAPDICLIQGPPGTGKTTVIAEACLQFAKRGETVLLASQAHDALDNALSRLQNNPNLRAIRLAKNSSRITDEGKEFIGEHVLAKQYTALKNYINYEYFAPQEKLQRDIEQIKNWIEQADFIAADLYSMRERHRERKQQLNQNQEQLKQLQAGFEHQAAEILLQQNIEHLIAFLKNEKGNINGLNLQLPQSLYPLVEKLCSLHTVKINQKFTFSSFLVENPDNQLAIFDSLFSRWCQVVQAMPKMQADLDRLQLGHGGLNTKTILEIEELEAEIQKLADLCGNEDGEYNEELGKLWYKKRRELNELKKNSNNLTGGYYQLFSDATQFTIQNTSSEAVKDSLLRRLAELKAMEHQINSLVTNIIEQLRQTQLQTVTPQNTQSIKNCEVKISNLESELKSICKQIANKKIKAIELIKQGGLNENAQIDSLLDEQKDRLSHLENELVEIYKRNKDFLPLLGHWQNILAEPIKRAKVDWNELESSYIKSCNVVAISCNEDERTLTDKEFDSFDVVIIDEVSKATPLELLLPLMRAKKAILVGDHRQLPPVFNEADGLTFEEEVEQNEVEERDNIDTDLTRENLHKFEKMVTSSLFKELFEQAPESLRERLDIQFRMHPVIMRIINYFYEDQLLCGNPDVLRPHGLVFQTPDDILLSKNDHLLWIDTTNNENGQCYKIEDGNNINRLEARMIAHTLLEIDRQTQANGEYTKDQKLKIGVVSFYQPQCRAIREEILKIVANKKQWFTVIDVEINTVIRYQGKEKPIILLSLVKNNGGNLSQKFRAGRANIARFEFINVAMSRAQNLLMVFGARNMLENREIKLPRMDRKGHDNTMLYKQIFKYLEYQSEEGGLTNAKYFAKALPIKDTQKR